MSVVMPLPNFDLLPALIGLATGAAGGWAWLRRQHEGEAAEAKRRQAQKVDALSQLAGGIAHDFNNLLAVIGGSLEIAMDVPPGDARGQKALDRAMRATQRAGDIVTRLQMFARKTPIAPHADSLAAALSDLVPALQVALDENIQIVAHTAADLWTASFDRNLLDTLVTVLAANARETMPDGGLITMEACNLLLDEASCGAPAGEYVAFTFACEGISTRALPPSPAKIAGAGLARTLAQNFARQCHGFAEITDLPHGGTTVRILLPRDGSAQHAEVINTAAGSKPVVLVTEDREDLRAVVVDQVQSLGYATLEAPDAARTLSILGGDTRVDLLLSDIILENGLNGRQLADVAVKIRPDLKVILCTGHPGNALDGAGGDRWRVLQKPVSAGQLRAVLAETLSPRS